MNQDPIFHIRYSSKIPIDVMMQQFKEMVKQRQTKMLTNGEVFIPERVESGLWRDDYVKNKRSLFIYGEIFRITKYYN